LLTIVDVCLTYSDSATVERKTSCSFENHARIIDMTPMIIFCKILPSNLLLGYFQIFTRNIRPFRSCKAPRYSMPLSLDLGSYELDLSFYFQSVSEKRERRLIPCEFFSQFQRRKSLSLRSVQSLVCHSYHSWSSCKVP